MSQVLGSILSGALKVGAIATEYCHDSGQIRSKFEPVLLKRLSSILRKHRCLPHHEACMACVQDTMAMVSSTQKTKTMMGRMGRCYRRSRLSDQWTQTSSQPILIRGLCDVLQNPLIEDYEPAEPGFVPMALVETDCQAKLNGRSCFDRADWR